MHRPAGAPAVEPPPAYVSDRAPRASREDLLVGVLRAMDGIADLLAAPDGVARTWEERAALRGRAYRVRLDATGEIVAGSAVRLADDGGLVLAVDGAERTIHLADARVV